MARSRRWQNRLWHIPLIAAFLAVLAIITVILQVLMGVWNLPPEGPFWIAISRPVCAVASWSRACSPASSSTSTTLTP
jgi:uncharacterized membrane protein HdeD (DUF308 family)